jgi:hypothetical protein
MPIPGEPAVRSLPFMSLPDLSDPEEARIERSI